MKKDTILYIDDDEHNLMVFEAYFEEKYRVLTATSAREGYDILLNENVKVVVTDQRMPVENGLDFIRRVAPAYPMVIYIILTAYTDLSNIKEAINSGLIYRYISKPWVNEDMENALENAVEKYDLRKKNQQLIKELEVQNTELHLLKQKLEEENYLLRQNIQLNQRFENIICKNDEFRKLLGKIETIATNDVSVLIEGETGTGKELIAHSIYKLSKRVQKPLVKLNCATLPSSLIESELFGHEKGAFTGAQNHRKGYFEIADKGTIFLDEIGELPLELQPKLLRVLQEGEFNRIGSNHLIKTDVRIIAATNRDLKSEVKNGRFRSDLYYRLNVFPLNIPPLRKRKEDIPGLVEHFVHKFNKKFKKNINIIPQLTIDKLKSYHWPGNIRELENMIERGVLLSAGNKLAIDEIEPVIIGREDKFLTLEEAERKHILTALELTSWKIGGKDGAAELLNINRTTLLARMKKLNIERD